ncbi:MAG: hypothetical protein PIR53_19820 [Nocardioides alkalitolerans]
MDAGVDVLLEVLLDELDVSDFVDVLDDELSLLELPELPDELELDDVPALEDVSVPRLSLR